MRAVVIAAAATALPFSTSATSAQRSRIGNPRAAPAGQTNLPPLTPAVIDNSLQIGGDEISARKLESRMTVEVHVNGYGPFRFVVDSGADTSVVGVGLAGQLKLPVGTAALLNSMTARAWVDRVGIDTFTVGPTTIRNLALPALREENLGAQGLLGIDSLIEQRLMLDFERRLIKVEDARKRERVEPDAIVITAKRRRGQLILTHVRASGVPLDAVIDTGSEITIGNSALRNQLLRRGGQKIGTIDITGVTGTTIKLQLIVLRELILGPVILQDVPVAFADLPPFTLFGLADEPALLLGTDLLENFRRVSLDFRSRKVRFELKKCESHGIVLRTTTSGTFSRLSASNRFQVCGG